MIPEKYIIILLPALRVAHEAHSRSLGTRILDYADMAFHEIVHKLTGKIEVLPEDMNPAIRIHKALRD